MNNGKRSGELEKKLTLITAHTGCLRLEMAQPHTSATDVMASTSNKRDSIVSDLKKPKSRSAFRRIMHALKQATPFKARRNHADSSSDIKMDPELPVETTTTHVPEPPTVPAPVQVAVSVPNFSKPSISEGDLRTAYVQAQDVNKHIALERPATACDARPPKLPTVSEVTEPDEGPEARRAVSEYQNSVRRYAASRRSVQSSRSATMITPELMQQLQRTNRRRSGASLRDAAMRPGTSGTLDGVPVAKLVVANPLRWSEE